MKLFFIFNLFFWITLTISILIGCFGSLKIVFNLTNLHLYLAMMIWIHSILNTREKLNLHLWTNVSRLLSRTLPIMHQLFRCVQETILFSLKGWQIAHVLSENFLLSLWLYHSQLSFVVFFSLLLFNNSFEVFDHFKL